MAIRGRKLISGLTLFLFLAGSSSPSWSAPNGGTVTAGSATITQSSPSANITNTVINQSTFKSIINWNGYGTNAAEAVNYIFPSAYSASLNRVTGGSASTLLGTLTATVGSINGPIGGQVFLINPNGILFGAGAVTNVGGLFASTLDIADNNFMNGSNYSFSGNTAATVVNQGTINGGFVALLGGGGVQNTGTINASGGPVGQVALGAGSQQLLSIDPNTGLMNLVVSGSPAAVYNSGTITTNTGAPGDNTPEGAITLAATGDINLQQNSSLTASANGSATQALPWGSTNINLNAGGNINATFASVTAAGQNSNVKINAGGDITANNSFFRFANSGDNIHDNGNSSMTAGGTLTLETTSALQPSGADLTLAAGKDLDINASKVIASTNRNLTLTAQRDINIGNASIFHNTGSNTYILAGHDLNVNTMIFQDSNNGDFDMSAGNNITLGLSEINARNGGNINIGQYTDGSGVTHTTNNIAFNQSQLTASARNNITIQAANDITANGSAFTPLSSGNFWVLAGRDLTFDQVAICPDQACSGAFNVPMNISDLRLFAGRNETLTALTLVNTSPNSNTYLNAGNDLTIKQSNLTANATQNNTSGSNFLIKAGRNIDIEYSNIAANGVASTNIGGPSNAGTGELDIQGAADVKIAYSNITNNNARDNTLIDGINSLTFDHSSLITKNAGATVLSGTNSYADITYSTIWADGGSDESSMYRWNSLNVSSPNVTVANSNLVDSNASGFGFAFYTTNLSIANSTVYGDNANNLYLSASSVLGVTGSTIYNYKGAGMWLLGGGQLDIGQSNVAANGDSGAMTLLSGNAVNGLQIWQSTVTNYKSGAGLYMETTGNAPIGIALSAINDVSSNGDMVIQGGSELLIAHSAVNNYRTTGQFVLASSGRTNIAYSTIANYEAGIPITTAAVGYGAAPTGDMTIYGANHINIDNSTIGGYADHDIFLNTGNSVSAAISITNSNVYNLNGRDLFMYSKGNVGFANSTAGVSGSRNFVFEPHDVAVENSTLYNYNSNNSPFKNADGSSGDLSLYANDNFSIDHSSVFTWNSHNLNLNSFANGGAGNFEITYSGISSNYSNVLSIAAANQLSISNSGIASQNNSTGGLFLSSGGAMYITYSLINGGFSEPNINAAGGAFITNSQIYP